MKTQGMLVAQITFAESGAFPGGAFAICQRLPRFSANPDSSSDAGRQHYGEWISSQGKLLQRLGSKRLLILLLANPLANRRRKVMEYVIQLSSG
jgi:hypothetical protein